jgi:hypothetical protein
MNQWLDMVALGPAVVYVPVSPAAQVPGPVAHAAEEWVRGCE